MSVLTGGAHAGRNAGGAAAGAPARGSSRAARAGRGARQGADAAAARRGRLHRQSGDRRLRPQRAGHRAARPAKIRSAPTTIRSACASAFRCRRPAAICRASPRRRRRWTRHAPNSQRAQRLVAAEINGAARRPRRGAPRRRARRRSGCRSRPSNSIWRAAPSGSARSTPSISIACANCSSTRSARAPSAAIDLGVALSRLNQAWGYAPGI